MSSRLATFPSALARMPALRRWMLIAAIVIVVAIAIVATLSLRRAATQMRFVTVPVQYGTIAATVNETGTINPVNEVNVGTQVSGTISSINADYNAKVREGQVLAVLNPTTMRAADTQAHAALSQAAANAAAQANTTQQQQANVRAAAAGVAKAQSQLALAQKTVARDRQLLDQGYIAQSQLDTDVSNLQVAQTTLASAIAAQGAAEAQSGAAGYQAQAGQAQVSAAQGQVEQADYNLAQTVIRSPIDGIVVSRNISVGQTVAASFQTPTLFVIASNLKDMQVDVSVAEADVGNVKVGEKAQITVPAFPNVTFNGTVSQVRVNPTVTQNVVTYDAIVSVHDESARLMPGMTANVTIDVATHRNVLLVPTAALLFQPHSGSQASGSSASSSGSQSNTLSSAPGSHVNLTVLRARRPTQVPVVIGLSDGNNVEIVSGDLQAGDRVVVAALQRSQATTNGFSPFGGGGPRGGGGGPRGGGG